MDASVTRRGQPCWYKKVSWCMIDARHALPDGPFLCCVVVQINFFLMNRCSASEVKPIFFLFKDGIGLDAINDSYLLEGSIYRLLRRHCRDQPYYIHLLELFTEVPFQSIDFTGTHTSTSRVLKAFLILFFLILDLFSNGAWPGPGPHDCPAWSNWPQQVQHGEVWKCYSEKLISKSLFMETHM